MSSSFPHDAGRFPVMQGKISRMALLLSKRDNSDMPEEQPLSQVALNVRRRMDAMGYNAHSLATAALLKVDAVRDLLRGKKKSLGAAQLNAVSRALKASPAQLLGHEPMTDAPEAASPEVAGQLIYEPAEIALIAFWRTLTPAERREALARLLRD